MLNRLKDNVTDVPGYDHEMQNNIGYKGGKELQNIDKAQCILKNNSFDTDINFSDNDFVTLDEALLTSPRKPDGSLPNIYFMKWKPASKWASLGY
jgi:hypothetical protein